ncbi:hypothetical protein VP01_1836g4 [Puccinia sorghi]|uniref:Uncharacterized protein n=1 Tax=Puccinia sorghi TaxID=27349 RepID=A0A0L6VDT7_9BASI|nr:hypothetical protein VP01_1836g4 [Puccinia sorghi]
MPYASFGALNNPPGINHWKKNIYCCKYLAGMVDMKLTLQPDSRATSKTIQHFTNATWTDDIETCLSRSGSICFFNPHPVAWKSKKQRNITLSSTEAELNVLYDGVQENLWIKFLIEEIYNKNLNPTQFNVGNKGLINKINNFGSNSNTKHLDIKAKWLRNLKKNYIIFVKLIPSKQLWPML